MKSFFKKIAAIALAAALTAGVSVYAAADNGIEICSTCGHTSQTSSVEAPYHYTYVGSHTVNGKTCTITRKVGILRSRCNNCGAIVSEVDYVIPTDIHSISHS